MMVFWLIAGLVTVSVAFLLPGNPPEVWPNLNLGGVVAGAYLIGLIVYTMREPFGKRVRTATWIVAIVTIPALTVSWTGMDATSHWQKDMLLKIRETIGRGIIASEVPDTLLSILDEFHRQKGHVGKKTTLVQIFQQRYPGVRVGDNVHRANHESDSLRVYVAALSDTLIALEAQEAYVIGWDPDFRNFNERLGMVQERYTLTAKGVTHESQN